MANFIKPNVYTGVSAAVSVRVGNVYQTVAYITDFTLDLSANSEDFNVIGQRYQESIPTYNAWTASVNGKASFENKGQAALLQAYQAQDFIMLEFIINDGMDANGKVNVASIVKATGFASIESLSIDAGDSVTGLSCSLKGSGDLSFDLPEYTEVAGIKVTPATFSLKAGSSKLLEVEVTPENATNKKVSWMSSDPTKATVNEQGFVIAKNGAHDGEKVVITAISDDNGMTASAVCTIGTVKVTGVTLNKDTTTLTAGGENETLVATVQPDDASNKTVVWTSSAPSKASVANGVVTPVSAGEAIITATTVDGAQTDTCTVTVNPGE